MYTRKCVYRYIYTHVNIYIKIKYIPSPVSPSPAEDRISKPGQERPTGHETVEGFDGMVTPLLSSPKRHFRASYIFKAFRSTLFTITDCRGKKKQIKNQTKEKNKENQCLARSREVSQ